MRIKARSNFPIGNTTSLFLIRAWSMTVNKIGTRALKKQFRRLLLESDIDAALQNICQIPGRQAVNPLFAFFHDHDELVRWRSVTAMGMVVSNLADIQIESARVVMRRLMWNLNDESGGIGWGSPEAMGDIMARHATLAREYHAMLISYIRPDGNFLEHDMLQRGLLWGLGRLAQARPQLTAGAASFLIPFLSSSDTYHRGLAAWAAGSFHDAPFLKPYLQQLSDDKASLRLYLKKQITVSSVGNLAIAALKQIDFGHEI